MRIIITFGADGKKDAADAKLNLTIMKLRELTHAKKAESSFRKRNASWLK